MITEIKSVVILSLFLILVGSCRDDDYIDKYERPAWLAGKVYTQLKAQPELTIFAQCIARAGYDTILDVSGSYTVFAPSDEAFTLFFQQHPAYKKVEDIPLSELSEIVKFHIVQNPWSKAQMRNLDVYGWIDTLDINNNKPRGFKRETLLMGKNLKYGLKVDRNLLTIVDTTDASWWRRVATDSRKYAPIFYKEYFDIYGLHSADYEFYFQRPFEGSADMYFAGAKLTGNEIFAENGFIHVIDRVVMPLKNAYEWLQTNEGGNSYSDFLNLVNSFPQFAYDRDKTFNQPGAAQGAKVDSLFNLSFPQLTFNINRELTKAPPSASGLPGNVTIRYHHGLMAPENKAFNEFINQYFTGAGRWGSLRTAPTNIKRIVVNSHMSINPVYKTNLEEGFLNGESDIVRIDQATIIRKAFGSNCTFLGLNQVIIPRAFKSVTGPIYLQPGYSTAMFAIESSGLLAALKRENQNYMLFVESDFSLQDDSSLFYRSATDQFRLYQISGATAQEISLSKNDLRNLILNHVGTAFPKGIASKEFIKTLSGNYLIVDNLKQEVTGTGTTVIGYNGAIPAAEKVPKLISTNADNGRTYEIKNWFSFKSTDLYTHISTTFPRFHQLIVKAGLANEKEYRYKFISESEFYTVFAPNDAAINQSNANSLPLPELEKFVKLHFIQGEIIFTDGNKPPGYYETTRVDEKSTPFSTIYTRIFINPEPDRIHIRGKSGENLLTVQESPKVNVIATRNLSTTSTEPPIKNILSTAVVHEIDKVMQIDQMDTK